MIKNLSSVIAVAVLLYFALMIYQPGLTGGFLLDDQASLAHLKLIDGKITVDSLYDYFAASRTGILKRPVSVFSFLLDAQTWPEEAYSFKRTNIIVHLINGALLYFLLFKLFMYKTVNFQKSILVAFTATALWLLNPFLVSTTLYVVQRMAMLPATFTLVGLLLYLIVRKKYDVKPDRIKAVLLFLIMSLATLLAAFSKENGVLFIFLLMLFEFMVCQSWLNYKPLRAATYKWVLLIPAVMLSVVIVLMIPGAIDNYDYRSFSITERILSQFRALSGYLYHLYFPDYFTVGVFTDGFEISKSLIKPLSTLMAIVFVLGLLIFSWIYRKRFIWLSFSVFFFFVSQLLESTVFPLEMYFEHRSYLSSLFIFVPLALLMSFLMSKSKIYILLIISLLALFSVFAQFRVNIWSNQILLLQDSMDKFPNSVRARTHNAMMYDKSGLKHDALKMIEAGFDHSDALELIINSTLLRCDLKSLDDEHVEKLIDRFKVNRFDKDDLNPMAMLMHKMILSGCDYQFSNHQISELLIAFENNPVTATDTGKSWVNVYWAKYHLFRLKNDEMAYKKYLLTYKNSPYISHLIDAANDFIASDSLTYAKQILQFAEKEYKRTYRFKYDWNHYDEKIKLLIHEINIQNK